MLNPSRIHPRLPRLPLLNPRALHLPRLSPSRSGVQPLTQPGTAHRNSSTTSSTPTSALIKFSTTLRYSDLPPTVVERTKDLFLDYVCCALAGRGYPSLVALENFAKNQGPSGGSSQILAPTQVDSLRTTSPYFAAMLNAAAGHIVEQDDLHNSSVVHPATVIFPSVLAVAQSLPPSPTAGEDFILASVVGYEIACRVGEALGKEHYRVFHTTGTAGAVGAAGAVAKTLGLDEIRMRDALGTAGTMASGLWEFAGDAAHSKQVHTAHAASTGVLAGYSARDGLLGAKNIVFGKRGMAAGMSFGGANEAKLTEGLGKDWKVTETSFKYWASCRHTHPSADALLLLLTKNSIPTSSIKSVKTRTYRAAMDVLLPAEAARTIHESKFSMGFVLGLIGVKRSALLRDFDEAALGNAEIRELQKKVEMVWDEQIESEYPRKWVGLVEVETYDGQMFRERVSAVKGDPDNTLSREEIMSKGRSLIDYGNSKITEKGLEELFADIWNLEKKKDMVLKL